MSSARTRTSAAALGLALVVAACSATPAPSPTTAASGSGLASVACPTGSESGTVAQQVRLGGYDWTRIDARQFGGSAVAAVAVMPDQRLLGLANWLAAVPDGAGRQPTVWTSRDCLAWSSQPDSPAFAPTRARWQDGVLGLAQKAGVFVAVGTESSEDASVASAAAWFSLDGVTWTRSAVDGAADRTMDAVMTTATGFVALGEARYDIHAGFGGGTSIWTSPDGRAWTRLAVDAGPPRGTRLRTLVSRPGGFLATATFEVDEGSEGTPGPDLTSGIWTSDDGMRWQPVPGSPLGLNDLLRTAAGYLAIGSSTPDQSAPALAWRSIDGRTWTSTALPAPADLPAGAAVFGQRIAGGHAGFVALGGRTDTFADLAWSSRDGVTWTAIDLASVLGDAIVDGLVPIGDALLLNGHRVLPNGSWEPVAWLLAP